MLLRQKTEYKRFTTALKMLGRIEAYVKTKTDYLKLKLSKNRIHVAKNIKNRVAQAVWEISKKQEKNKYVSGRLFTLRRSHIDIFAMKCDILRLI